MMIYLHLTAEQREEVQRVSRHTMGRVALRAHMVLLSDRAYSTPQISHDPRLRAGCDTPLAASL